VPDQTEAAIVRQIFDLYTADRLGTQAIATGLNQQGLRTRQVLQSGFCDPRVA
jgi:site-specific DNA recombinase